MYNIHRQELASREHMLDHGQLGPPTPAVLTPASSRRPSTNQPIIHKPSLSQPRSRHGSSSEVRQRRASLLGLGGLGGALSMSAIDSEHAIDDEDQDAGSRMSPIANGLHFADIKRRMSGTKTPPSLPQISETPGGSADPTEAEGKEGEEESGQEKEDATRSVPRLKTRMSMEDAKLLGRSLSDAVLTPAGDKPSLETNTREAEIGNEKPLVNPAELAARLYSNPKLAALKSPTGATLSGGPPKNVVPISPPILDNPKCSGYFVEPVSACTFFTALRHFLFYLDGVDGTISRSG